MERSFTPLLNSGMVNVPDIFPSAPMANVLAAETPLTETSMIASVGDQSVPMADTNEPCGPDVG